MADNDSGAESIDDVESDFDLSENERLVQKKLKDRTRIRVYGFHSWIKLQPCLLIGGDP